MTCYNIGLKYLVLDVDLLLQESTLTLKYDRGPGWLRAIDETRSYARYYAVFAEIALGCQSGEPLNGRKHLTIGPQYASSLGDGVTGRGGCVGAYSRS